MVPASWVRFAVERLATVPLRAAAAAVLGYRPRRVMASLPRSGTHWLKTILADIMGRPALEERFLEPGTDLRAALSTHGSSRLVYEHFHWDRHSDILDCRRFPEQRLVILIRHPLDAALSQMHFRARSGKPFPPDIRTPEDAFRAYVRNEGHGLAAGDAGVFRSGIREFLRIMALGWMRQGGWHVVRYENLLADPVAAVSAAVEHLLIPATATQIQRALSRNSFEKLSGGRKPGVEDRKSHYRKGVAGGWREVLSADDIRTVDRLFGDMIREMGYDLDA